MATKTKTKQKIEVHIGLLMGILLVCGGIVIGSFGLNMVSALSSGRGGGNISCSGWQYVYGPEKNSETDFYNLANYINAGSEVRVGVGEDNADGIEGTYNIKNCREITYRTGNQGGPDYAIECRTTGTPNFGGVSSYTESSKYIYLKPDGTGSYILSTVMFNFDGTIETSNRDGGMPVSIYKWYVKK